MNFFPLKYTSSKVLIPLSLLLSISSTVYAEEDKLEFSGFARVILGYLDDKNAEYVGYDNSLVLINNHYLPFKLIINSMMTSLLPAKLLRTQTNKDSQV